MEQCTGPSFITQIQTSNEGFASLSVNPWPPRISGFGNGWKVPVWRSIERRCRQEYFWTVCEFRTCWSIYLYACTSFPHVHGAMFRTVIGDNCVHTSWNSTAYCRFINLLYSFISISAAGRFPARAGDGGLCTRTWYSSGSWVSGFAIY